jgi:Mrp family chromosome partitioning ATPase
VPFEPDPSRAGVLALLAFIVVAGIVLAVAWLVSLLRNGLEQAEAVEQATGLPVLAVFPTAQGSSRARRDAADILRGRLAADSTQAGPAVIVVTSPTDSAEKEGLAIALAESFGRAGQQTLLLDGNLRAPSTGDAFRLNEGEFVSLEQFLADPARRLEFVSVRLEGRPVFSLIPSFTPAGWPADLLRSSLGELLKSWQRRFPVIIIDAAPLLPFPDTPGILGNADTVILATKLGLTAPEAARQAASTLLELHGRLPRLVVSERDAALARFQRSRGRAADDYAISILRAPRKVQHEGAEAALHARNPVRSVPGRR